MERIAAHCFFICGHVERHTDRQIAHDRMEAHYQEEHADEVARLVGAISTAIERSQRK